MGDGTRFRRSFWFCWRWFGVWLFLGSSGRFIFGLLVVVLVFGKEVFFGLGNKFVFLDFRS